MEIVQCGLYPIIWKTEVTPVPAHLLFKVSFLLKFGSMDSVSLLLCADS
jgi:hypothetical protein